MLKRSKKAGLGSVRSPIQITVGVKPQSKSVFVFSNKKLISRSLSALLEIFVRLSDPNDRFWRFGTGIVNIWICD
jgi:hypothetical protein